MLPSKFLSMTTCERRPASERHLCTFRQSDNEVFELLLNLTMRRSFPHPLRHLHGHNLRGARDHKVWTRCGHCDGVHLVPQALVHLRRRKQRCRQPTCRPNSF